MAVELELKPGQTPLDPDEAAGLKPKHISTQGELDEWEAENLLKARQWLNRQKKLEVLNEHFCRDLHKKMFSDTWVWAGTFRRTEKNISCDPIQISIKLNQLLGNVAYWVENETFTADEIAARFHHQLVSIVRYADDANVYVRSQKAGQRVMALLRCLYGNALERQLEQECGGECVWSQVSGIRTVVPSKRGQTRGLL